ncbi:hypothetical protein D8B26_005804 [Coccidioides posadasii str. Silveira]|uniref:Pre-rRNA-processing protein RIX1 n=1 Tax=Coccidioides posadasii (strain RMSCC 757 / Silveira) TaxID=443226 RepID=E9DAZ4_COCPS|nr:conserved hypothetical protein [Coccidioides posadasii str. Silveira]QVM11153.1 hypothetical protein D8B26_005804 [Coccidioides posadasii str. Silveira]
MASTMALRAATHRLTITPVEELPSMAAYLASTLGESSAILSTPEHQRKAAGASDTGLLVTKLKARITSLLQDRSIEGRWTAIILAKAAIEAGQWEILRGCEPWVRALLAILAKPDPSSSKKLALITLTRIFRLTHQYPTLTREITTPCLPSFVTSCLNLISVKSASDGSRKLKQNNLLIIPVFSSFLELLPNHPTIFRPFSAQLHDLLVPLIGSLGSNDFISEPLIYLAQRLFVSLHHCAPKNTSGDEWVKAYRSTISSAHRVGDHLFRAVIEQWESVDVEKRRPGRSRDYNSPVGDDGPDPLGLQGWDGVQEGSGRLVSLLRLLSQFLSTHTHSSVSIPIGYTLDLTARLASLSIPGLENEDDRSNLINRGISRDERESLFSELPSIHVSVLNLLSTVVKTIGAGSTSIAQTCLDQALWIFDATNGKKAVRIAAYGCIETTLPIIGYTFTKAAIGLLAPAIRLACADLLPQHNPTQLIEKAPQTKGSQTAINADAFLGTNATSKAIDPKLSNSKEIQLPGLELLANFLTCIPTDLIPLSLRAEIDRTAILTGAVKLMMASVLNPIPPTSNQRGHASIMPFLARSNIGDLEVEGLLRPRMPVLVTGTGKRKLTTQEEDIRMEREDLGTMDRDIYKQPTLLAENSVLTESIPKPMDIDTDLESRGTKRGHETDSGAQISAPSLGTQPEIVSPDKKPRTETSSPMAAPLQSIAASEQKDTSSETPILREPLDNKPLALESSLTSTALSRAEVTLELPEQTRDHNAFQSRICSTMHQGTVTKDDEEMASDDEIPQLNLDPDTDEDDDVSMQ